MPCAATPPGSARATSSGADDQSAIADAYRVSAIPAHFFVDRSGVLREIRQGGVSTDSIAASVGRAMAP